MCAINKLDVYSVIDRMIARHDLGVCTRFINEINDADTRRVAEEIHKIYKNDPDIVGILHKAERKIEMNDFKDEMEKEAWKAFRHVIKHILSEKK